MLITYQSTSGKRSGVTAYQIGDDYITVHFERKIYTYTVSRNGQSIIDHMKSLALASRGLSTFISKNKKRLKHS